MLQSLRVVAKRSPSLILKAPIPSISHTRNFHFSTRRHPPLPSRPRLSHHHHPSSSFSSSSYSHSYKDSFKLWSLFGMSIIALPLISSLTSDNEAECADPLGNPDVLVREGSALIEDPSTVDRGIQLLQQGALLYRRAEQWERLFHTLIALGTAYFSKEDLTNCLEVHRMLVQVTEIQKRSDLESFAYLQYGTVLYTMGRNEDGALAIDKALNCVNNPPATSVSSPSAILDAKVSVYETLGLINLDFIKNRAKAKECFQLALAFAQELGDAEYINRMQGYLRTL
eukprot:TRINITY_DN8484_c0_g1_i1.p1 TRINITY_DN8484_c0_g1~~TRINITY_DN8484_c0_g1_i1.p1  ORF type:complete len:294 (+),score=57.14 TRINITY_DN8484_c0_g1_i1:31-882(+)